MFFCTVYAVRVFCIWQGHITFLTLYYHKIEGIVHPLLWSIQPLRKYNPWLLSEICVPGSKRGRQLYLCFAAVGKVQTLTAETSPFSNGYQAINLPVTGLFKRVLDKENLDENLFACGKRGIQYKSQVRLSMRASTCIYIFSIIFQCIVRNFSSWY